MRILFTHFQIIALVSCLVAGSFFASVAQTESWQYLQNSPNVPDRFDDIYFVTDSIGWAVNSQGRIYKTVDAGNDWQLQLQANAYFRSVEFLNMDTGFAGTLDHKFYKTINGGEDWYNIMDSLPISVDGICGMSHAGNTIYACGIWSSPSFVLKSVDAGKTWTFTNMSAYADALVDCYFFSEDTGFVSGSENSFNGNGIILKTVDGGASWQVKKVTDIGNYVWKMDFVTHQLGYGSIENFSDADSSAILKTTDGGETWQRLNVTEEYMNMEGIGFLNDTLGWCGGWCNGMWETQDGGLTWAYLNVGSNFNRYFRLHENLMYAAGLGIFVYQTEDLPTGTSSPISEAPLPHKLFPTVPNPFSNTTTIHFELDQATRVRIELFNSQGIRVCDEKPGYLSKGLHQYVVDAAALPSGEYLFVLKTNERTMSTKIICQKNN